ncbi:Hypothetical predicted protein [Olea europaea subsp. europaea]|uniref:Uncharacterized protein n=1 Tax=Olea europaea subsp. europaea TaxID=158383 RepID=A0A8S0QG72_OLEEU|nr:Hypothetical predicted protein [Olea europaea subsp. europaea]
MGSFLRNVHTENIKLSAEEMKKKGNDPPDDATFNEQSHMSQTESIYIDVHDHTQFPQKGSSAKEHLKGKPSNSVACTKPRLISRNGDHSSTDGSDERHGGHERICTKLDPAGKCQQYNTLDPTSNHTSAAKDPCYKMENNITHDKGKGKTSKILNLECAQQPQDSPHPMIGSEAHKGCGDKAVN